MTNTINSIAYRLSAPLLAGLLVLLTGTAGATMPQPGAEQLEAFRRMQCSVEDGKPAVYWWLGRAYSRVPGEADRLLFRVEGMNIRQCGTVNDPEKGKGFRLVTKEILVYQDPKTGEVLETWDNPWTGETVEVIHVANDPVNQAPMFPVGRGGKPFSMPFQIVGDQWWVTSTIPLFYGNPLGGDYQAYVGGTYHATEMFNFMGNIDSLEPGSGDTANIRVGWQRLSSWLPWMKNGDRAGIMYFHTAGRKLESYDDLSDLMKQQIRDNYPAYDTPPPVDDTRPNETSWTYFKKVVGAGEQQESGH
jgi:hypothetical protein